MTNATTKGSILAWGWAFSVLLLITYLLCVAFGLIAPDTFHMHEAWAPLLPGFDWLTWPGFFAGAIGSFLYGWYPRGPARPLFQKKDRVKNRQCGFIRCREFRTGRKAYDNAQLTLFRFVFQQKEGIVPAYGYRASAGHLNPSSAHRARLWVWRGSSGERAIC